MDASSGSCRIGNGSKSQTLSSHASTWEASMIAERLLACLAKCGSGLRAQWHCKFKIQLRLIGVAAIALLSLSLLFFPTQQTSGTGLQNTFELRCKTTQANKW